MAAERDRKVLEQQIAIQIKLLQSGKFSDFVFECKTKPPKSPAEFKVHRAVIYGESSYLDKLIDGGFKVCRQVQGEIDLTGFKECIEQRAVSEEEPGVMATMFWFIYTATYPYEKKEQEQLIMAMPSASGFFDNKFEAHIKVFDASERLMLPSMRERAREGIIRAAREMMIGQHQTTTDFEAMLQMLYSDDSTMLETVREIVLWLINHYVGIKKLEEFEPIPYQLLWDLYRKSDSRKSRVHERCQQCRELFSNEESANLIVQEKDENFSWVKCCCDFTGLCSDLCDASDMNWPVSYCTNCVIQEEMEFECRARRRNVGLKIVHMSVWIWVGHKITGHVQTLAAVRPMDPPRPAW